MTAPERCIWIRPIAGDNLEIILLGSGDEIDGAIFARVRATAEHWRGWDRVDVLVMGAVVVGLRCHLGPFAGGIDLIAEGVKMLASAMDLRWAGGNAAQDSAMGMLATW